MVWTHKETRPRIRRKKDTGDGITWEKEKKRKAETAVQASETLKPSGQQKMKSVTELAGGRRTVSAASGRRRR